MNVIAFTKTLSFQRYTVSIQDLASLFAFVNSLVSNGISFSGSIAFKEPMICSIKEI